jgi:hypothetical protein
MIENRGLKIVRLSGKLKKMKGGVIMNPCEKCGISLNDDYAKEWRLCKKCRGIIEDDGITDTKINEPNPVGNLSDTEKLVHYVKIIAEKENQQLKELADIKSMVRLFYALTIGGIAVFLIINLFLILFAR